MESVLELEPVTLEGCRARIRAIEAAWPDVLTRLHGSEMRPQDEAYWRDWKRLPKEETTAIFQARMRAHLEEKHPILKPAEVAKRACTAAYSKAMGVLDALGVFTAMFSNEGAAVIEIKSDALEWLVHRVKADISDLGEYLEHAEKAMEGKTFHHSSARYASKGAEA